jgi:hypothetical protein
LLKLASLCVNPFVLDLDLDLEDAYVVPTVTPLVVNLLARRIKAGVEAETRAKVTQSSSMATVENDVNVIAAVPDEIKVE